MRNSVITYSRDIPYLKQIYLRSSKTAGGFWCQFTNLKQIQLTTFFTITHMWPSRYYSQKYTNNNYTVHCGGCQLEKFFSNLTLYTKYIKHNESNSKITENEITQPRHLQWSFILILCGKLYCCHPLKKIFSIPIFPTLCQLMPQHTSVCNSSREFPAFCRAEYISDEWRKVWTIGWAVSRTATFLARLYLCVT